MCVCLHLFMTSTLEGSYYDFHFTFEDTEAELLPTSWHSSSVGITMPLSASGSRGENRRVLQWTTVNNF